MPIDRCSIHGRFQPFHNAHLAYAQKAFDRFERVYIGLTRVFPDVSEIEKKQPHRIKDESNPFTYFERAEIIESALEGAGIDKGRFDIGPFPIERPTILADFWPLNLPCLTTIVDSWNEDKAKLLTELGYSVEIVQSGAWRGPEFASGTKIRALLERGDSRWAEYVPKSASTTILKYFDRL